VEPVTRILEGTFGGSPRGGPYPALVIKKATIYKAVNGKKSLLRHILQAFLTSDQILCTVCFTVATEVQIP